MRQLPILIAAALLAVTSPPGSAAASSESDEVVIRALMSRFDMPRQEVEMQVSAQKKALQESHRLRHELGDQYAGSWYDQDSRMLFVAATSRGTSTPRSSHAVIVRAERSLAELKQVQEKVSALNSLARPGTLFHRIWIDYRSNQVVAEAAPGLETLGSEAIAASDLPVDSLRVELADPPVLLSTLRAGEGWRNPDYIPQGIPDIGRCSIGFAVDEGFITAAHCGTVGDRSTTRSGQLYGSVTISNLPAPQILPLRQPPEYQKVNDVALVGLSGWTAQPQLYPHDTGAGISLDSAMAWLASGSAGTECAPAARTAEVF